jgi:hypothetical protein
VSIEARADRVLSREEIVDLADAIAASAGIASGIGTDRYGAQLVVQAQSREEAIAKATGEFATAADKAGLPAGPVVRAEAVSEAEDADQDEAADQDEDDADRDDADRDDADRDGDAAR